MGVRGKAEREEVQRRFSTARKEFTDMLRALAIAGQISSRSSWRSKVRDLIKEDPRYDAMETDERREDAWKDFRYELEKKEKGELLERKNKALAVLKEVLSVPAVADAINSRTSWETLCKLEPVAARKGDLAALGTSDIDRELGVLRKEAAQREEQTRRQREKELRELSARVSAGFEGLVAELLAKRTITPLTRYSEAEKVLSADDRYKALHGAEYKGHSAATLYDRVLRPVAESFRKEERTIMACLRKHKKSVGEKIKFEDMYTCLIELLGRENIIDDDNDAGSGSAAAGDGSTPAAATLSGDAAVTTSSAASLSSAASSDDHTNACKQQAALAPPAGKPAQEPSTEDNEMNVEIENQQVLQSTTTTTTSSSSTSSTSSTISAMSKEVKMTW